MKQHLEINNSFSIDVLGRALIGSALALQLKGKKVGQQFSSRIPQVIGL